MDRYEYDALAVSAEKLMGWISRRTAAQLQIQRINAAPKPNAERLAALQTEYEFAESQVARLRLHPGVDLVPDPTTVAVAHTVCERELDGLRDQLIVERASRKRLWSQNAELRGEIRRLNPRRCAVVVAKKGRAPDVMNRRRISLLVSELEAHLGLYVARKGRYSAVLNRPALEKLTMLLRKPEEAA